MLMALVGLVISPSEFARDVARILSRLSRIGDLSVFYVLGLLPAFSTGLLTEWRIRRNGSCVMFRSAMYGSLTSVVILATFSLFVLEGVRSFSFGSVMQIVFYKALLGFFGTLPVWWLTRGLQRRISNPIDRS